MTNAELNARAAEIMGLESFIRGSNAWYQNGSTVYRVSEELGGPDEPIWSPAENIAQAMLLFHKFGGMDILVSQDGKTFQAREPFSSHRKAEWYSEFEPTVERAILCACVAAAAAEK